MAEPSLPPHSPPLPPPPPALPPGVLDWNAFYRLVRDDILIGASLSLAASVLLLLLYYLLPRVRRTPGWMVMRASMCECVVSACFLVLWLYGRTHDSPGGWLNRYEVLLALLVALVAFETAAHAWRVLMYLEIAAIYRNPFEAHHVYYGLFVLTLSALAPVFISLGVGILRPPWEPAPPALAEAPEGGLVQVPRSPANCKSTHPPQLHTTVLSRMPTARAPSRRRRPCSSCRPASSSCPSASSCSAAACCTRL